MAIGYPMKTERKITLHTKWRVRRGGVLSREMTTLGIQARLKLNLIDGNDEVIRVCPTIALVPANCEFIYNIPALIPYVESGQIGKVDEATGLRVW